MDTTLRHAETSSARSRRGRLPTVVRSLLRTPGALFGLLVVITVIGSALLAPMVAPFDPVEQNIPGRLLAPAWPPSIEGHLFGTDALGRDILTRMMYGAQISLLVGVGAVAVAGVLGVLLGLLAGYYGGWVDHLLMRLVDIWQSIPFLVLAIAIVAVLGPSLTNLVLVLALTGWVTFGRVVRSQVLALKEGDFVEAARALGATNRRIMLRHILPNAATSIIVIATLQIAQMITMEAALSFLGLGVQPPQAAWGSMVAEGKDVVSVAWWLSTFPGLAVVCTVLGVNLLGDWLRDALDPRLQL